MVGVRVHERGTEMRTSPSLTARLAIHAALLLLLSCVATHASSSSDIQSHRGAAQAGDSANFFCTLQNERVKMDLEDYDLPDQASYVVGVKEKAAKAGLLADLNDQFDWRPQYEYSSMSMFSGFLSPDQVQWLLQDTRTAYVECDGFVKVARKKGQEEESREL
mmetsp:Transcript_11169/g.28288  ORF Transcript_11169/g.28288 Transcript_11169/m.28288 type:complete len:163 (-) Transcript_11169:180-668(-)